MSAVVAGTKAKLQDLLPGRIGDNRAFSTSYIEDLIMAGFYAVCEECEILPDGVPVELANDTLVYDLDSSFIGVSSVEWVPEGGDRSGHLTAVTLSDLDKMSRTWRDSRGAEPEYYSLFSAPGIPETSTDAADGSQLLIWRALSAVASDEVRVNGPVIGTTTTGVPEDIQRLCLVPYVMSHVKAVENPRMAHDYYNKFIDGMDRIKGRYLHRYTQRTHGGGA